MKSTLISKNIQDQYPILCDRCLGENPYVKMTKDKASECKVCLKPYTGYRWRPGKNPKFLSTVVCQVCARIKNVCQACVLDLQYGITVKLRDSALGVITDPPKQSANLEYYLNTNAAKVLKEDGTFMDYRNLENGDLMKLTELAKEFRPVENGISPQPCSFFSKGKCTRGASCPYLHDLVVSTPQTLKALREKYYGTEATHSEAAISMQKQVSTDRPSLTDIHSISGQEKSRSTNIYGTEIDE